MEISSIPFGTTDWSQVPPVEHKGETGMAYWRTREFGSIRVRMVEYTPGYLSYQVADNAEPHRSHTDVGAKLFIVD
jgi:hypothetical protein